MDYRNELELMRSMFDAIPAMVLVVDEDVRIQEFNAAAAGFFSKERPAVLKRRGGELLHCLHATEVPEGCGRAPFCRHCVIRNAVAEAFRGERIVRRRARLEVLQNDEKMEIYALVTASPFSFQGENLAILVIEDISEIAELQRMIPICSVCRRLRDEQETWSRIETYFKDHWDVDFSHGLCPECYKKNWKNLKKRSTSNRLIPRGRRNQDTEATDF